MKDKEFIKLKKTFFKSSFFIIIFMVPFTIALVTKFGYKTTNMEKSIRNNESLLILVTENSCSRCKEIKGILKEKEVPYYELNYDKTTINEYQRILRRIKIGEHDIKIPTLIYIQDGNLKSSLVDIKDKNDLLSYIENINYET